MSRAVLIFAGHPQREPAVKSATGDVVPRVERCVAEWLHAAAACDAMPVIACDAEEREVFQAIIPEQVRLWLTPRGTAFPQRLAIAATDTFALGFRALVIASLHAPPPKELNTAFETVELGGNVVAPTPDGGVHLLGLRQTDVDLLSAIQPKQKNLVGVLLSRSSRLVILPTADAATPSLTDVITDSEPTRRASRDSRERTIERPGDRPEVSAN